MYICDLGNLGGAALGERMDLREIMNTGELLDSIQVEGRGTAAARAALANKFGVDIAVARGGPSPGESVVLTDGIQFLGAVAL